SRRLAVGGAGIGLTLAGLSRANRAAAQAVDYSDHPLCGTWLAMANPPLPEDPQFPSPALFAADGTALIVHPATQRGPQGVVFGSPVMGMWEPDGDRTGHFTVVQLLSDAAGAFTGTITIDGWLEVGADDQSLLDDGSRTSVTFRDASNLIVNQILPNGAPAGPGVQAARMGVGMPGFPDVAAAAAATPMATPAGSMDAGPGERFDYDGITFYYEAQGPADGQPVLLLHGGLGSTAEFDGLVPDLLAAGYRTVAMDSRGRGRSTWDGEPFTYEQMADDAVALLDHLGITQTDLVGWSDGGNIGLILGIHHPERLQRAVIYGANFTPDGFFGPEVSDQMPPFEDFVDVYQRVSPQPDRFFEVLDILTALYGVAPDLSEEELGSITVPMLILDGAEEEMIKPDQPVRMAELIPGAELIIMPGTGHFAPIAKRDEFNQIVLQYLAG
ncbi:MAG: alpha/beta hydrolase, partial [Thermomicrobiales bacterium]